MGVGAVNCVGGCNEVMALRHDHTDDQGNTTDCLAYHATPYAHSLVQVKTNLGGTPTAIDVVKTRKWYCNHCIEACNPPLDPSSRELEHPAEFEKNCKAGAEIQRKKCVKAWEYGGS